MKKYSVLFFHIPHAPVIVDKSINDPVNNGEDHSVSDKSVNKSVDNYKSVPPEVIPVVPKRRYPQRER